MSSDEDFLLALQLQEHFSSEMNKNQIMQYNSPPKPKKPGVMSKVMSNSSKKETSVVDPSWEYIDPTPDIHALFIQFDNRFFWGALKHVEVRWSPRMTSCAGICCYEGRGGLCSVRLSVPLLKLRPRKDLVETLLHEMIHAYLFVTHNNRDRDGHGPEFHKHMYRINKEAGTKITVYHSFHDEVKLYQQHWWRCNGPCQKRPPYFGMVKRSMNRAPGPSDFWWSDHESSCGGRYIKVREPEGFSEKKGKQTNKNSSRGLSSKMGDIRSFLSSDGNKNSDKVKNESSVPVKENKVNNIVGFRDMFISKSSNVEKKTTPSNNIVGMKDMNGTNSKNKAGALGNGTSNGGNIFKSPLSGTTKNNSISGKGSKGGMLANKGSGTLVVTAKGNKKEETSTSTNKPSNSFVPFSGKGNKLGSSSSKSKTSLLDKLVSSDSKSNTYASDQSEVAPKRHSSMTEKGAIIKKSKTNVIDLTNECNGEHSDDSKSVKCPICGMKVNEIDINTHLDSCLENSSGNEDAGLCSVICPSSNKVTSESELNVELDTCSGLSETESGVIKCPACNNDVSQCKLDSHLEICLGSIFGTKTTNGDGEEVVYEADKDEYPCPCCGSLQKPSEMNSHLDQCLGTAFHEIN